MDISVAASVETAYERAFEEHWHDVFRFALSWTNDWAAAEDLAHEAYVRLWQGRTRIDWQRSLLPWLLVTTRRLATDRFRELRRRVFKPPRPAPLMHPWWTSGSMSGRPCPSCRHSSAAPSS